MLVTTCALLLTIVGCLWWRAHRKYYAFLRDRGIPGERPTFPFGNMAAVIFHRRTLYDLMTSNYARFKSDSFFGYYEGVKPVICVLDPQLIKQVTLQAFDHFVDHQPLMADPDIEPLISRSVFTLSGDRWHDMRTILTPAFTGGRVAGCFQQVSASAQQAVDSVTVAEPNLREVVSRFVTDVTASLTFGIEINSFEDPTNKFYRISKEALDFTSCKTTLKLFTLSLLYTLKFPVRMRWYSEEVVNHFSSLVLDTIAERQRNSIRRPDIIQMLLDAQTRSQFDDGEGCRDELGAEDFCGVRQQQWDNEELISQCFMLFITGYMTITTTLEFLMYELVQNPAVQTRLLEEIDGIRRTAEGRPLQYCDLQSMSYMDMVISETMRKWPKGLRLTRRCVKDYRLTDRRGKSVDIEAGDNISIPIVGLHLDPEYFPDPHRFDPLRFSDERKSEIPPFTYLPFGAGPRNCMASRLALAEMKVFVYHFLSAFTLHKTKADCKVQFQHGKSFQLKELHIGLTRRK